MSISVESGVDKMNKNYILFLQKTNKQPGRDLRREKDSEEELFGDEEQFQDYGEMSDLLRGREFTDMREEGGSCYDG